MTSLFLTAQSPEGALNAAIAPYHLYSEGLKPWHLSATVQIYSDGKPWQAGTVDVYYAGAQRSRTEYKFPSFTQVVIQSAKGRFISGSKDTPSFELSTALRYALQPAPRQDELNGITVEAEDSKLGKLKVHCYTLQGRYADRKMPVPLGINPSYCVDDGQRLRAVLSAASLTAIYNKIGNFQGTQIPMLLTLFDGEARAADFEVKDLRTFDATDDTLFTPSADAESVGTEFLHQSPVIPGSILSKTPPVYPPSARADHIQGTVVLKAIIGLDGRIHYLHVVSAPRADLAYSAIMAVRQWRYKPYLLAGVPTEVDTTLSVNYNIGR